MANVAGAEMKISKRSEISIISWRIVSNGGMAAMAKWHQMKRK
jgi:hypothetical protein